MNIRKALFTCGQQLLLRRAFHTIRVSPAAYAEPALVIVNHSSFYDSLVLFELQRKGYLPANAVALMNAAGRNRIPLFKAIGTIPVSNPMKLSEYKTVLQQMQERSLIIFPQGEERHLEERPLALQEGTAKLLAKNRTQGIIVVAIYYSMRGAIRGEIACRLQYIPPAMHPEDISTQYIEKLLTTTLTTVKADVIAAHYEGYEQW